MTNHGLYNVTFDVAVEPMKLVTEEVREDGGRYVHEAIASTLARGGGFQTCPFEIEVHRNG